ncbi:PH domain-containing protein [soil metagenome]
MSDGPRPDAAETAETAETADAGASDLSGRLHPSVIALWSFRGVAPLAALWLANSIQQTIALVAIGGILGASWVRWRRFTWRIDDDGLVIEHGLIERTRRVIPIERIQAVQTVRKVRHRVFGVVGLRIEAIGGSDTEGQLDALTPTVARRAQQVLLRRSEAESASASTDDAEPRVYADTPAAPPGGPGAVDDLLVPVTQPGTVLARCTPRMLLVAGLTGGRVGVAAAAIGVAQQVLGDRIGDLVVSAPERFGLTLVLVLIVVGVIAAFVLSVIATAVTYWDFTVRRDGRLLRLHRGLLDERRDTVPIRRVQSLTVEQNILRRAFGLASVRMVVAGRAGDDGDLTSTLLPISDRAAAMALVGDVLDTDGLDHVVLTPMPPAARHRRLARAAVATGLLTAAGIAVAQLFGPGWQLGLLGLASAAVAVPAALASYRALGWAQHAEVVVARSGWLVRRLSVTPVLATQSARLSSSPFQRRRDLATLHLEIARSRGGRDPRLLDIAVPDGAALQRRLADAVAMSH